MHKLKVATTQMRGGKPARGAADPTIVAITISVLIVLAFAGFFIGRGFVEEARDSNAQSDLARISAAQEFYASQHANYTSSVTDLTSGRIAFTPSADVAIEVSGNSAGWIASAKHEASGNTIYRSSTSPESIKIGPEQDLTDLSDLPTLPSDFPRWSAVEQD